MFDQYDAKVQTGVVLEPNMFKIFRDILLTPLMIGILVAFWPLRTVPTGSRGVVTIGGSIRGIQGEGFILLWPWESLSLFNIRAEEAPVNGASGPTIDLQTVTTSMMVRYSITPDKVSEVYEKYSHTGDLTSYVQTATQESFKAVTVRYTATDLIAKRSEVSAGIYSTLSAKLSKYGAQVINIDMTNFDFSKEYMAAINAKTTQDQLLQAAEKKLLTVTAELKQKTAQAEADASVVRAKADGESYSVQKLADGEAYATTKNAEASARALTIQNEALSRSRDVLELKRIEVQMAQAGRWNGALPGSVGSIYGAQPMQYMQVAPGALK